MDKSLKIIVIAIFSYLTTMLLCFNANINLAFFSNSGLLTSLNQIMDEFDLIDIIFWIIVYFFYYSVFFNEEKYTKKNLLISLFSIAFAVFIVIGKNLQLTSIFPNLSKIAIFIESVIMFFGSYLAFYAISKKIISIDFSIKKKIPLVKKTILKKKMIVLIEWFKKHPFFTVFMIIFLVRVPYLIIYYPGNANGDTFDQLCQLFNNKYSWTKDMVNLVNSKVYLNNHHPVFSTLYLGIFVKIGVLFNNLNFGLFTYTFFQTILSSLVFSFLIFYFKKIKIPNSICNIMLVIICLIPFYSFYTNLIVKDTPQALFVLLYVIFLIQIVRNYSSIFDNKLRIFIFIIIMLMVMLFRNNGIITILLSYPFLLFLYKKHYKKLLVILFIPILIYLSFNQIMYNCFDVSKGSKKEMLSIPFMQVARLVNRRGNDVMTLEDQKIVNKVISYKKLKSKYNPNLADDVKDTYNKKASTKDLINFFKVWAKYFFKYPNIYIESFINSTYQYFYPYETYENNYLLFDSGITSVFPSLKQLIYFKDIRLFIFYLFEIVYKLPVIGIIFKVAFYDWVLILSTCYVIYKKNYKYLIPLMALLSVLLVCLASPINGSMRYILPIIFSFPAILSIDYLVYKESK